MITPGSKSYLALIAAAVLSVSCSDAAGPDPDPNPLPDPVFIGSSVAPGPANVLSAVITVNATGFDAASVRMRTPGEPDLLSPPYAFDEDVARPACRLGHACGQDVRNRRPGYRQRRDGTR